MTQRAVFTGPCCKGTIIEVNVSELGLVTPGGRGLHSSTSQLNLSRFLSLSH